MEPKVKVVILTFPNRELMDKTLRRWKKFRRELNKQLPKHAENAMEDVYGFAYWLFRYSGLKISE
jgi:hypothetical protein